MKLLLQTADGLRTLEDSGGADTPIVGVLPGDDIALHRLHLAGDNDADRLEDARMRATDLAAQPIEELHVATGHPDDDGASWVAIIDRGLMAGHVEHFRIHGAKPAHLVPAALLLDAHDDQPTTARLGDMLLFRNAEIAGLVDSRLAQAAIGAAGHAPAAEFAPVAPAVLPLDLMQGAFAPRREWWKEQSFSRAFMVLGVLLLLALPAPAFLERARDKATTASYDDAVVQLTQKTLGAAPADAAEGAAALAKARHAAEGAALGSRLSFVAAQTGAIPGARLTQAELGNDGALQLALGGPANSVNRLAGALMAGPFDAEGSGLALKLGNRRTGVVRGQSMLQAAMARFADARSDAAIIRAAGKPAALSGNDIVAALQAAGLAESRAGANPAQILVPAARSTTLLPILARLESKGARFVQVKIAPNQDQTVNALLEVAP